MTDIMVENRHTTTYDPLFGELTSIDPDTLSEIHAKSKTLQSQRTLNLRYFIFGLIHALFMLFIFGVLL